MKKKWMIGLSLPPLVVLLILAGMVGYHIHGMRALNPEQQYFQSDDVRIHYAVRGAGVPIVLVHGLAVNGGINFGKSRLIEALAQNYQVITLDLRGHGRSDKPHQPEEYGVRAVEDIVRLMDHLGIEKAHVLGYSMGGFIVLKLAALHPDRLLSFMPCASGWTDAPEPELAFFNTLADALERGKGYGILSDRLTPIGRKVKPHKRFLMSVGLSAINDNEAIAAFLRTVGELRVAEDLLKGNAVPALALVGERDPLRPFAEQMATVTAHMQLVIVPDGDHMSTLGKPETLSAIQAFLQHLAPESS